MNFRWDIIVEYAPFLWKGALLTIGLSIASILLGVVLGLFIGLGKTIKNKALAFPFVCYITIFRGTPLFLQILIVYFGVVPAILGETNGIIAGIIAMSLNSAAYVAEIFRAGIESIDRGQMEGARSLGMTQAQAMGYVILPQAFKRMIPPLGNEFIVLLKDSSLLSVVAVPELMYYGKAMGGQYFKVWEPYLSTAAIYLILTILLSFLLKRLEERLKTE